MVMSAEFWDEAIIAIFFFYGLAFYSLGLALFVESGRASELGFAHSMRLLAGFGILHGIHEWIDMLERTILALHDKPIPIWLQWLRLALLITSFLALLAFGGHLLTRERTGATLAWQLTLLATGWYAVSCIVAKLLFDLDDDEWRRAADVLSRYVIGIPGALFAGGALLHQRDLFRKRGMGRFVRDLNIAALALIFYGGIGQLFPAKSEIFPSDTINTKFFQTHFGFPIQLFRAAMAVGVTVALIQVLRALEVENEQRLATIEGTKIETERQNREALSHLNQELQAANEETSRLLKEVQHRDMLRGELLHHITAAQEAERQRIARELHDGTGQALTGFALGMKGLVSLVDTQPDKAKQQLTLMGDMAGEALGELRLLINDLRPPQLDDMGLVAALRWMVERANERGLFKTELQIQGTPTPLSPQIETTLFRIAQEALTNVTKHANAHHVRVSLNYTDHLSMLIHDDGIGFEPAALLVPSHLRTSWGLIGMQERANLINAQLKIESQPGHGTALMVTLKPVLVEERE
jgi:signal transduction histidine kinase